MEATTYAHFHSMSTMSSPRLPAELTDQIIHHLQCEQQALFIVSLVCRAWVPAARCHLFRAVRLERIGFGFGSLTPYAAPTNTDETLTGSMSFIQLLKAEHCTMRTAVQELSIDQRGSFRRGSMAPGSSAENSWMDHVLAATAMLLPSVLRLRLEGVHYPALSPTSKALLIEGFQSVMELDLAGMRFGGEAEVAELVASFPATKSVDWSIGLNTKFAKLGAEKDENAAQVELQLPATFSRCTINAERACSSVGKALASRASELTLTSEEKYFSVTQTPALNELFAASGDQLKHLVYNVWHWTATPGSFIDIFDRESSSSDCSLTSLSPSPRVDLSLSKNTSLESLLFHQFRFTHPVLSIPSLLSSIPSTALSTIVFEVDFSSPEYEYDYECAEGAEVEDVVHPLHLCDYDWESVDEAIKGAVYAEGVDRKSVV